MQSKYLVSISLSYTLPPIQRTRENGTYPPPISQWRYLLYSIAPSPPPLTLQASPDARQYFTGAPPPFLAGKISAFFSR